MQSTTLTTPSAVSNSVSSTSVSPAVAAADLVVVGDRRDAPVAVLAVPSSWAKHASESKRGRHSQSIDPLRPTRAAVWVSPMIP